MNNDEKMNNVRSVGSEDTKGVSIDKTEDTVS